MFFAVDPAGVSFLLCEKLETSHNLFNTCSLNMTRTRSYNSAFVLALCLLLIIASHISFVNAKRKRHDGDGKGDRGSTRLNPAISTESDKWKKDDHKFDVLFGKASGDDDGFSPFLDNDFDRHKKRHKRGVSSALYYVCSALFLIVRSEPCQSQEEALWSR